MSIRFKLDADGFVHLPNDLRRYAGFEDGVTLEMVAEREVITLRAVRMGTEIERCASCYQMVETVDWSGTRICKPCYKSITGREWEDVIEQPKPDNRPFEEKEIDRLTEMANSVYQDIVEATKMPLGHLELFYFVYSDPFRYYTDKEIGGGQLEYYEYYLPELKDEEVRRYHRMRAFIEDSHVKLPANDDEILYNFGRADSYGLFRFYMRKCGYIMDEYYAHAKEVFTKVMRGDK